MAIKQNSQISKKEGGITRQERTSVNEQAESMLKEIKEKSGDVVLIAISSRTMIELPANLTQVERDARVEKYIRLHNSKI